MTPTQYSILALIIFITLSTPTLPSTHPFTTTNDDPQLYLKTLTDPAALCLDGSPAAYYISTQGDPKKIYLEFEGGGWCSGTDNIEQVIESCYRRSSTDQGSSRNYPSTVVFKDGVLSINEKNNFKDWTRVLLKYCDGSGHQGTRQDPIQRNGTDLYFRGHNITIAQLDSLQKDNKLFSDATHVVVGGNSDGGIAVYLWTNYIKEKVKKGKVWGYSDSGVYMDAMNIQTKQNMLRQNFLNLMVVVNEQISLPVPECVKKYPTQPYLCMFIQNIFPFVNVPIFISQSLYDTWSIANILGITCLKNSTSLSKCSSQQMTHITSYHKNLTLLLIGIGAIHQNGIWAPGCASHEFSTSDRYYSEQYRVPQGSQNSVSACVDGWINNPEKRNNKFIDLEEWPGNGPCSGKKKQGYGGGQEYLGRELEG